MSDIIPRRPEGVGVSPGLGTVLAPVIYLLLLAAGTTVLSIVFSGMRQPDWMSRDPSGWFWGAHRQALDMGVGLAISVLPSITHTYQIVDWLSGKSEGDVVDIVTPGGRKSFEVVEVRYED